MGFGLIWAINKESREQEMRKRKRGGSPFMALTITKLSISSSSLLLRVGVPLPLLVGRRRASSDSQAAAAAEALLKTTPTRSNNTLFGGVNFGQLKTASIQMAAAAPPPGAGGTTTIDVDVDVPTTTTTTTTTAFIVVYVTVPSKEAAKKLAESIVQQNLAACVNRLPGIESVYKWQGMIQTDNEELLIIKTRASLLDALTEHVKANHEYDVPEVIALPIVGGSIPYLEWIKNNTRD